MQPARVWLHKRSLDRRIAQGADPHESPELARRVRQLSSRRWRNGLAVGLRRMVEAAEEPRSGMTSQVPLNRREILADRELFLELARDLSSPDDLKPRGIACVERLLTDSCSPCFVTSRPGELGPALRQARAALHLA